MCGISGRSAPSRDDEEAVTAAARESNTYWRMAFGARGRAFPTEQLEGAMYSVFYIIGVIVVVLAILSLLGLR